jgi:hypothetical protein
LVFFKKSIKHEKLISIFFS